MTSNKDSWLKIGSLLGVGIIAGYLVTIGNMSSMRGHFMKMNMDEKRGEFIWAKNDIIGRQMAMGDYACCLEKPCSYCIEKTPGHGEGAKCNCLKDVVEGKHPCGECIGEIMEGHGNKYLAKYFARSIAEEVGPQHLDTLRKIIEEKYGKPVSEQL
ncbi:MAG: hypothetical protein COU40_02390 [Candidatus Moranbacteria bacterium CG10_big_fil_rev_8_21_14_0_10_35_21]|nr:MAG: hypothetical protein COU40_02390 [Candidatus Moranbacteria bacterium CG10_big_fil_rev_8_21_14_0_10_35_21]PJA88504.1 MAG: hypothetical protein CO139_02780 [Candidatus Moranbacteria bacterium CG_4_9_14_3_um_filter_36_9]